MGHSIVGTTLNLYSHMFQEARARNCDAITNALRFTREGNNAEPKPAKEAEPDIDEDEDELEEEKMGQTMA